MFFWPKAIRRLVSGYQTALDLKLLYMPSNPSNQLSGFLSSLSPDDRDLLTLVLDLQLEGRKPFSDSEQEDLLEARILKGVDSKESRKGR